jgi:hypothetical protein
VRVESNHRGIEILIVTLITISKTGIAMRLVASAFASAIRGLLQSIGEFWIFMAHDVQGDFRL